MNVRYPSPIRLVCACAILSAWTCSARAEDAAPTIITLEHALTLAVENHPDLDAFVFGRQAADARALQAGLRPNPELEVEVESFGGSGAASGFDSAETTALLSQTVELAGKRAKRRDVATLQAQLTQFDLDAATLDVLANVHTDFVDVLSAERRLALAQENALLAEDVVAAVAARVEAGTVPAVEEQRARIEATVSEIDRNAADRALAAARARLANAWGTAVPETWTVSGDLALERELPDEEHLQRQLMGNPDLTRWTIELQERRAALALEEAQRVPDLTLTGGVRWLHETDDEAFVAGVSLPLPLFDRNQGNVQAARHEVRRAERSHYAARLRAQRMLSDAYQALASAHDTAMLIETEALPLAEAAFEATREGYQEGKLGSLVMLDAQRALVANRTRSVEALTAYHHARAQVARLLGLRPQDFPTLVNQNA